MEDPGNELRKGKEDENEGAGGKMDEGANEDKETEKEGEEEEEGIMDSVDPCSSFRPKSNRSERRSKRDEGEPEETKEKKSSICTLGADREK